MTLLSLVPNLPYSNFVYSVQNNYRQMAPSNDFCSTEQGFYSTNGSALADLAGIVLVTYCSSEPNPVWYR